MNERYHGVLSPAGSHASDCLILEGILEARVRHHGDTTIEQNILLSEKSVRSFGIRQMHEYGTVAV